MKKNELSTQTKKGITKLGPVTELDWYTKYDKDEYFEVINKDQEFLRMLLDVIYPDKYVPTNFDKVMEKYEKTKGKGPQGDFCKAVDKDNELLRKILEPVLIKINRKATKK